jgi:transposase-like protein
VDHESVTLTVADVASQGSTEPGKPAGSTGPRAGQRTRRTFTAAYKIKILTEFDALTEHGARGALLRREGLYHSHLIDWRKNRDAGALGALSSSPAPAKTSPEQNENRRLKAENARMAAELVKVTAVVEALGKVSALLEILSESADTPSKPAR